MLAPTRIAMLVAVLLAFGTLPAAAQQAVPATPRAAAPQPVPEAVQPAPSASADLQAAIRELQREVYALGQAARERATALAQGGAPVVLTTDQLAAIAGGALVGAIAADIILDGGLMTMIGALAGGVIGHWFYNQPPLPAAEAT